MHTTLASIEENVSRLDSEVEDLKTKSKQLDSTVNELEESIQFGSVHFADPQSMDYHDGLPKWTT